MYKIFSEQHKISSLFLYVCSFDHKTLNAQIYLVAYKIYSNQQKIIYLILFQAFNGVHLSHNCSNNKQKKQKQTGKIKYILLHVLIKQFLTFNHC